MNRTVGLAVAGVILLAIVAWLVLSGADGAESGRELPGDKPVEHEPDLFATNVAFDQLNPDGTLNYRLVADTIIQYPTRDDTTEHTELKQPNFHLIRGEDPPWDISADQGRLEQLKTGGQVAEDVLHLTNDVVMVQEHPVNGLLTIRSDSFTIFPKREYAETDDDVIIDTETGRTEAAGMQADLASGLLTLRSSAETSPQHKRVHTVVLPEQFK